MGISGGGVGIEDRTVELPHRGDQRENQIPVLLLPRVVAAAAAAPGPGQDVRHLRGARPAGVADVPAPGRADPDHFSRMALVRGRGGAAGNAVFGDGAVLPPFVLRAAAGDTEHLPGEFRDAYHRADRRDCDGDLQVRLWLGPGRCGGDLRHHRDRVLDRLHAPHGPHLGGGHRGGAAGAVGENQILAGAHGLYNIRGGEHHGRGRTLHVRLHPHLLHQDGNHDLADRGPELAVHSGVVYAGPVAFRASESRRRLLGNSKASPGENVGSGA
mmetsp:Transcript_3854/g.9372  ORF Transcript_3854/g.9372 Transcript_3854/m.9372 type:complete len:271 (-) Transcript_3854:825-1637(-)